MRILLVEDDKLIGDGIKAGLSKMGFSIDSVSYTHLTLPTKA